MAGVQQVDSDTLRTTGGAFATGADQVRAIIATISNSVAALLWTGGIAQQFTDDFNGQYKPMLDQLQQDMDATRQALDEKAAEYDLVFGV